MYSLKMFRLVFAKSVELATFQRMSLRLLRQPFIDEKRQKKKSVCLCIRCKTSYTATHTDEQMDRVLEAFKKVGKKMGVI